VYRLYLFISNLVLPSSFLSFH